MAPGSCWLALWLTAGLLLACTPAAPAPAAPPTAPAAPPAPAAAPTPEGPLRPPVTVRVGVVGATSDAGIYIAQERGYFREQGIEIDLSQFQTGPHMVPPLAQGQLDVGGGAPSAGLVNALAREIPIRIVADKGSTPPGFGYLGVLVRKDLVDSGAFQGCPSFRGMRVAFAGEGITTDPAFDRLLRECGLTIADVEMVLMGYPDVPAALRNGAVEAGWQLEPGLTRTAAEGLGVIYKRNDEFYPDQQVAVLMYGPQFIANQREVAQRFMVAYIKGVRDHWEAFTRGVDKAAIIDILTRNTVVKDPALYERMAPPGLNPDGYVYLRSLSEDIDWWVSRGYLPARVDPAQIVDHSFVDYALARLGRYAPR
ncbi:MAG TPA: ABC transporter substrate-binding protein [Chloroflexota bacterium]|nr:ABC transporter substrate-binding protein [Chloroflexota bacterium]